jgi:hypothetical protein
MTEHLIHIGYAKTGTTFLRQWFGEHPEVQFVVEGIAGFRDAAAIVRAGARSSPPPLYWVTSAEAFSTPHAGFGTDEIDYEIMQKSSMRDAQSRTCHLLRDLFPTARILVVTRGFRSMILSGYSQYVRTGGQESLATVCAQAAQQAPWDYDFLIEQYRRAFGEANVMVLPYELLQEDPARFLECITGPLGLATIPIPAGRPNPSLSPVELAWYPELARRLTALPEEGGVRRDAMEQHLRAMNENSLRETIEELQRTEPREPVTAALLTGEVLYPFRSFAQGFRENRLYRSYAREYLFDQPTT